MTDDVKNIAKVLLLNGRQLIGKTRLQKTVYFLEAMEAGFGFDFDYYHYGPYSEELSIASDDAVALGAIEIEWKASQRLQAYAVFRTELDCPGEALDAKRKAILEVLDRYDSVSLELAATADFLKRTGEYEDSWIETRNRKTTKATAERMERAKKLLRDLEAI